jgi:hypothetical protein
MVFKSNALNLLNDDGNNFQSRISQKVKQKCCRSKHVVNFQRCAKSYNRNPCGEAVLQRIHLLKKTLNMEAALPSKKLLSYTVSQPR